MFSKWRVKTVIKTLIILAGIIRTPDIIKLDAHEKGIQKKNTFSAKYTRKELHSKMS